MLYHKELGTLPEERNKQTRKLIRSGHIQFAGYKKARIYGLLRCASGKRMKMEHRVFFANEAEALTLGYRPCGHCMRAAYKKWKAAQG